MLTRRAFLGTAGSGVGVALAGLEEVVHGQFDPSSDPILLDIRREAVRVARELQNDGLSQATLRAGINTMQMFRTYGRVNGLDNHIAREMAIVVDRGGRATITSSAYSEMPDRIRQEWLDLGLRIPSNVFGGMVYSDFDRHLSALLSGQGITEQVDRLCENVEDLYVQLSRRGQLGSISPPVSSPPVSLASIFHVQDQDTCDYLWAAAMTLTVMMFDICSAAIAFPLPWLVAACLSLMALAGLAWLIYFYYC